MPLNKLDSIIKNTEGRILYVSPADLDSTDSIANQGNSLARPFKTLQRALIESARFSYVKGNSNDLTERTTILLMPGEHVIDNRPGYTIDSTGATSTPDGAPIRDYPLSLDTVFDLSQKDNDLYKFNSVNGGVIVPRGTSIIGLDLRKTKLRPTYVPNPTYDSVDNSSIFRITGACYFWQFSIFDGDEFGTVYTQPNNFEIQSTPTFSHNKLTVFEYADGVNEVGNKGLTDLEMYYAKLSRAYGTGSGRTIDITDVFPTNSLGFNPRRPEFEIVGAFASDPIDIASIISGNGGVPTRQITVTTQEAHGLNVGTPIIVEGVTGENAFNISTKVTGIDNTNDKIFTYSITADPATLSPGPFTDQGTVKIETDTVTGASPYIFNISMRSVWGMNGMHTDGSKATGFRSMVVAQFTGVSLQKDDRAFVKYNESNRTYENTFYSSATQQDGSELSAKSSSSGIVYHLDSESVYRKGWEQTHIKITNDAIVQIVSVFAIGYNQHFTAESGGDASVTNSNSNFGQLSLISKGFKKEAFEKDNKAFITHIIPPRAIESTEEDIDWLTLDQDASNSATKLYLFGFVNESIKPPVLTQGYRVGAKVKDKLFLGTNSATIVMPNSSNTSSFEEYTVSSGPSSNFEFTIGSHSLETGEKVIIISDDGDLPENLRTNTVYFVIKVNSTQIKLAASLAEAAVEEPITVYGGTNLKILSRVSDKDAGDVGSPIQYDESANQWFVNVQSSGNTITSQLTGSGATEPTTIKRVADNRSLDEKVYKVRVIVPSQLTNGKTPESGFIIQESSSTGFVSVGDTNRSSVTTNNYDWNRNPRFIKSCSRSTTVVTVDTELPHNLQVGDSVTIRNVTDSTNPTGLITKGYNGTYTVSENSGRLQFKYVTTKTPSTFTNNVNIRSTELPRFERTDCQENLYVYRNEIISEYDSEDSNGVYHLYLLNSNNAISQEFTNLKYSQNVTDLYPQLDRDNFEDNPKSAKTFALRSPIGEVQTDDLKNSITRESADALVKTLGIGLKVTNINNAGAFTPIVTFDREHNFAGIVTGTAAAVTSGFTPGTYYNVKIYNNNGLTQWSGATAEVSVTSGGNINSVKIMSSGSNYSAGTYYLDTGVIGTGNNKNFTVVNTGISTGIGEVLQFTGRAGIGSDNYHRITEITGTNSVRVRRKDPDTAISAGQYAFNTGNSIAFTADSTSGIVTATGHGLAVGNKFRSIDGNNNNRGDYIVETVPNVNTFTVTGGVGASSGLILKHGLSSNKGISDKTDENLQARSVTIFDGEVLTLTSGITTSVTSFSVFGPFGGVIERFPLGTYLQVDNEIMRIASDSLSGVPADKITVIRGALATKATNHVANSVIKKIKIPAIEFHRPSIIRASGHTFEYLGYGPGNYSTALPQVQDRTLTEREEFLSQAQERSGGLVVYTGMNNKGDFFIGNQKKSSATGEETNFDIPVPTITGEDPSRLSAVFDEVTIKERLVVEGGDSNQVLSQFDGPVTFNQKVKITASNSVTPDTTIALKISNTSQSNATTSGALVVSGGAGIGKNLNVGGDFNVGGNTKISGITTISGDTTISGNATISGITTFGDLVTLNVGIVPDTDEGAYVGTAALPFSEAHFGEIRIAVTNDNTIDTATGNLILDSTGGTIDINDNVDILGNLVVNGNVDLGDATSDTITATGRFDSDLVPSTDDARDLGSSELQWKDLFVNGTATIDTLTVDESATVASNLTVTGNLDVDGITTLDGTTIDGVLDVNGSATIDSVTIDSNTVTASNFNGNATSASTAANLSFGSANRVVFKNGSNDGATSNNLTFDGTNLTVGGDITAFSSSDKTLKTDIKPIENAISKVLSISGNTFVWNEKSGKKEGTSDTGVIAQEIEALELPGLVSTRDEFHIHKGTKAVRYDRLVPLLIEAIKELSAKVDELEQKLSDK